MNVRGLSSLPLTSVQPAELPVVTESCVRGCTRRRHRQAIEILAGAFRGTQTRFCVVSFTSDWLYPTRESKEIVQALNAVAANVSFVEIDSDKGHDAFLLEEPELFATVSGFLNAAARKRGIPARDTMAVGGTRPENSETA